MKYKFYLIWTHYKVKDRLFNNKIYVSYTREMTNDCWNTSVIFADLNFND